MGNDVSRLSGLEINEKAIEVTDFCAHYHATVNEKSIHFGIKTSGTVSVFKGETAVLGPLWALNSPLEKCSNNLLKYRHPSIQRYISSWRQHSNVLLATEMVHPLSQMLSTQCSLQICIGLSSILQALVFLHDTGKLSHNNVCIRSIYVTPDGSWKLGGMEFSRPFIEMNTAFLKQTRNYRYEKAIDPNEDSQNNVSKVDQYAFGTLVDDVFRGRNEDEVPNFNEFKQYCHSYLQNADVALRPNLRNVLHHEFFNHDFIAIHNFLSNLPLKSESDKSELFGNLLPTLHKFSEETVARQLGGLLLSRLVLLDSTARDKVLPQLLRPRNENSSPDSKSGFFTFGIFKKYITPKLLQVFCVRDAQIRTLLLIHFHNFVNSFGNDELTEHILPELLLGIKDTDDNLVSMTLRCLADLVSLLGAETVIGGKRAKIFSDGRPLQHLTSKLHKFKTSRRESGARNIESTGDNSDNTKNFMTLIDFPCSEVMSQYSSDSVTVESCVNLQERPSPDGGEDLDSEIGRININLQHFKTNIEDNWSDWNENDKSNLADESISDSYFPSKDAVTDVANQSEFDSKPLPNSDSQTKTNRRDYLQKAAIEAKAKKLTDINELDIKMQTNVPKRSNSGKDEFDFFADMEPVIEKAHILSVEPESSGETLNLNGVNSKFHFIPGEDVETEADIKSSAWNDDEWT